MKRQIICLKCYHPLPSYPGEWFKMVRGRAWNELTCDLCGATITADEVCLAQSFGPDRNMDYYPWEADYLKEV